MEGKGAPPSYYGAIYIHIIHGTEMAMAIFGGMNLGATILATSLCVRAGAQQQCPEGNPDLGPLLSRWAGHLFRHALLGTPI